MLCSNYLVSLTLLLLSVLLFLCFSIRSCACIRSFLAALGNVRFLRASVQLTQRLRPWIRAGWELFCDQFAVISSCARPNSPFCIHSPALTPARFLIFFGIVPRFSPTLSFVSSTVFFVAYISLELSMFPIPTSRLSRGPRRSATVPDIDTSMSPVDEHDNEHSNSQSQAHSPTESDSGFSPTDVMYPVRRRATAVFAKDWQLRALKRLYMQTARPSEAQKRVAAAETGL